jgi:predicted RNA-binding Zn ribbon-like protein
MNPRFDAIEGLPIATRFLGGPVCLDFANTTERLQSTKPNDWLTNYAVLLAWCRARGTLGTAAAHNLASIAKREHSAAAAVFEKATTIRTDIRKLAAACADGEPIAEAARRANTWLTDLPPQPAITLPRSGAHGRFRLHGATLDEPLWPILWSLTSLLTSEDIARVRRCEGHGCGYYFVDATPNRSRRFCSSVGCGNRARARRFHHLHRRESRS